MACYGREACTIELCFHEDAYGAVQSMTIEGSSGWKFHGKTLMRVKRENGMDTTPTPGQTECEDVEPIKHQ